MKIKFILLILVSFGAFSCGEKVEQEIQVKNIQEEEKQSTPTSDTISTQENITETKTDTTNQSAGEQEKTTGETISTRAAGKYIGENKTVRGYVADVNKRQKVWYLNFDDKYPNNTFTGVIFPRSFESFPDIESYEGKTLEISGEVSEYNGKAQIILIDPSQIKVSE